MLGGERAEHAVAGVAQADDGHERGVDIVARGHRVRDRGEHGLPVRAQQQAVTAHVG